MAKAIKVLVAKPGLDGHESGARLIARALRDCGMEVVYTGSRQTPDMIVRAALQEDVDVIGLSVLSGVHMGAAAEVLSLLKQAGADDIIVLVGGIIPDRDIPELKRIGVKQVFGPGTDTRDVEKCIRDGVAEQKAATR